MRCTPAVTMPGATMFRDAAIGTLFDKMRISRDDATAAIVANQLFLPSALGGFGLADPVKIAPAAYLASIIACSPLFVTTSFDPVTDAIVTTSIVPQLLHTITELAETFDAIGDGVVLEKAAMFSLGQAAETVERVVAKVDESTCWRGFGATMVGARDRNR